MGRHSVPDDDDVADGTVAPPVRVDELTAASASRPRPARHDDGAARVADARTDPQGLPPVEPPPVRAEPITRGGQAGKPRPGAPVRTAAARSGPAPREPVAAPPRADDDTSPGLALIERALDGGRRDPVAEPAVATDQTVSIEPIVDPVLDEAVPEAVTEQLRPVTDDGADGRTVELSTAGPAAGPAEEPKQKKGKAKDKGKDKAKDRDNSKGEGRTSDLALLRAQSALRARVAAALVVPFLLYVSVLLIVDSLDVRTALIWIWIPLVTAGVVSGLLLDIAHREAAAGPTTVDAADGQRTDSPERAAP